jgi:hypothetical protein
MRKVFWILPVLAVAFTGYWIVVARGVEAGLRGWFAEREAAGWVAEHGSIRTSGFPLRFQTVLRDVTLADPATGVAWDAPRFAFEAQAFAPNRITAVWPFEQTFASPYERIRVESDRFTARIGFVPGTRLELREIAADLAGMSLSSTLGWETQVAVGHLSARLLDAPENAYDIRFEATGLTPTEGLRRTLDPARLLPDRVEGMTAEARAVFDAPWDRFAVEAARPQVTSLALRDLRAQWGGIEVRAAGDLAVDENGVPEGRITVKVTNWRDLLRVARNAGLLPEPLMPTIERAFEILAGLSGPPETLDAPLTFANGNVSFGPVPLGRAPRLVLR